MMKLNLILEVLSAAAFGFFIGVSFPVQIAPQVTYTTTSSLETMHLILISLQK
jgi:hypothetical protein